MNIVVCVKQISDSEDIKYDIAANGRLFGKVKTCINPLDKKAVEAAVQLKEKHGGSVTIISLGPLQCELTLQECIAMGADEAILVSDPAFDGGDAMATSYVLAAAIRKAGEFDLVICGQQSNDSGNAQVGARVAEHLGMTQITSVASIEIEYDGARIEREHEDGIEIVGAKLPMVITVVHSINSPRYPSVGAYMEASCREITVWSANDLELNAAMRLGKCGSAVHVVRVFAPPSRASGVVFDENNDQDNVDALMAKLYTEKIVW